MSDRHLPARERAILRARQIIEDEVERAGIFFEDPAGYQEIAEKFVDGVEDGDTQSVMQLLALGQGRGGADNQGISAEQAEGFGEIFGIPAVDLWRAQREGWDGYGWNDDKIKQFGRKPEDREYSRGGRWANTWEANQGFMRDLLQARKGAEESHQHSAEYMGRDTFGLVKGPDQEHFFDKALSRLLADHSDMRSQTHGESGWLGAAVNPEYMAGQATGAMQTFGDAIANQAFDENPEMQGRYWEDGLPNVVAMAEDFYTKYYPEARIAQDVKGAARRVEPTVPMRYVDGQPSVAAGARELNELEQNQQPDYDDWYRHQTGQYPGYLHSSLATFGNALLDPTVVAFPLAGKITSQIGKGLLAAGKALRPARPVVDAAKMRGLYQKAARLAHPDLGGTDAAMKAVIAAKNNPQTLARLAGETLDRQRSMPSEFLRRWGTNLRQGHRWEALNPFLTLMGKEVLMDELPTGAGIQAGLEFGTRAEEPSVFGYTGEGNQDAPGDARTRGPVPTNWFGGQNRTDKHVPAGDGSWRDRTPEEFEEYYQKRYGDHLKQDLLRKNQSMLDEINR